MISLDYGDLLRYGTDILLVTYVIYKIIMLIRGTRAVQLLKGIMVIVITWLLSKYFQLTTLHWLMSQAFTFGVLAVVIIFQPELRRALEQLGRGKLFSRSSTIQDDDMVNRLVKEVCKSVTYMAKRRIGALIVIERETGLNDYVETGIAINGRVSSELLINIFIPNTPLHDGAVIMRKDVILAAACYLPLSESNSISKELGTRHRAAIGVSEVSDGMSIIVSEETGQVSFAAHGTMNRNLTEEQLAEILTEQLQPLSKSKSMGSRWHWRRKHG
ncbi:diadenylate cyclase CdaA [Brevibacillus centrosporus]|uniref:Diadenylate cyclase n=1 Tax=Brevibacillus centrosporus TaxID=54910 RepID=A0A1I4EA69_9BACL|nr:diadenylate cyclase CdaA [Brevibacillus centrosporus]MED1953691.1 diadenylate cyclase CdaA [Brevibacillus centrosporus]SFL02173.1 diadenylate cyclase [Brevibacillus centrosporus]